jgi:phosphatidylserine/phosphatidylglycerophosphate/cardiolipin synthase-like enzyme
LLQLARNATPHPRIVPMKLIVQPDAGIAPVITAIKQAKKSIDVLIFRLDRAELARALEAAVGRGINVRALTAHTNRGGEKNLRKLELELLQCGVTVSRTADDLLRYHGKMMIVDNAILHVYGFNFTGRDMGQSRSLGIVTKNRKLVQEASKLFEADFNRQPYTPGAGRFVVSPENGRERLTKFIQGARRELLIYDPKVSDDAILRILVERHKAGVDVKVIGRVEPKWSLTSEKFPGKRLHIRAIVRDGARAFIGSQSLRRLELEKRREVGVIVVDPKVVNEMKAIFQTDWAQTESGRKEAKKRAKSGEAPLRKVDKKAYKKAEEKAAKKAKKAEKKAAKMARKAEKKAEKAGKVQKKADKKADKVVRKYEKRAVA